MCGRSNPGLWGFGPALRQLGADFGFTQLVIGACVTIWVIMLLLSGSSIAGQGLLSALSPNPAILALFGESGTVPVFGAGRWWTVLSAGWLHRGLLHILFNMYWLYMMGPAISDLFGSSRTVIIYTIGGIAGFLLSSLAGLFLYWMPISFLRPGGYTVGASAPVFGLIGALYHYGRMGNSLVKQQAVSIVVQAAIFGVLIQGIDNYAHAGGFIGGYLTSAFLNPLTRERGDHLIIAFGCLLVSFLAIAYSIIHGLGILR